jgi:hypothetical protein
VRTHQEIDERSLTLHRMVADKIRQEPERFARARAVLEHWRGVVGRDSQPYLVEWERLFERGVDACLAKAVEDSEHAAALRQCSPLACVLTNQERFAFLRTWSREHEAQPT